MISIFIKITQLFFDKSQNFTIKALLSSMPIIMQLQTWLIETEGLELRVLSFRETISANRVAAHSQYNELFQNVLLFSKRIVMKFYAQLLGGII